MTWLSRVFELNPGGLNRPRAVAFLDAAPVLMFVFWAIGNEVYLLSALFGLLFAALADPGGSYGHRVLSIALFPLIGAGVTALALGVGSRAWGWLVLVAFVVTLAAGLAAAFAVRRFVTHCCSTSGSSLRSDSRSASMTRATSPTVSGRKCSPGPEGPRCGSR
ncbi:hypothetical protein [Streptomyces panaciradicis]|uniref:hypothetical protein n=1 Tax=Streptomyces panaciradicis TaxID=1470261 RepID=UPI00201D0E15|nr:hypothetical protein [Streptomyces panaciradicis]MCL6672207.1 hypothetical protein [Streptomyces panaciradicis]